MVGGEDFLEGTLRWQHSFSEKKAVCGQEDGCGFRGHAGFFPMSHIYSRHVDSTLFRSDM